MTNASHFCARSIFFSYKYRRASHSLNHNTHDKWSSWSNRFILPWCWDVLKVMCAGNNWTGTGPFSFCLIFSFFLLFHLWCAQHTILQHPVPLPLHSHSGAHRFIVKNTHLKINNFYLKIQVLATYHSIKLLCFGSEAQEFVVASIPIKRCSSIATGFLNMRTLCYINQRGFCLALIMDLLLD